MRQVTIEHVQPGMVTARHIFPPGESRGLPLLAARVVITEAMRDRLQKAKVETIVIDDDLSRGIEPQPPITDETRRTALAVVRDSFTRLDKGEGTLPKRQLKQLEATITAIVGDIAERKNLLVCLSDLNVFGGARMQHAINVCVLGCAIARRYFDEHGWVDYRGNRRQDGIADRLQKLGVGLLLQDIGSLAVPQEIWDKRGMLSADERRLLQQHPLLGVAMLDGSSDVSPLTKVTIAQHHERYDGTGYPRGLAGDDLHDNGQIAGIAEAYVSLCEERATGGRPRFAAHQAYEMILQASGKLYHPTIVEAFADTIAPYGPGTTIQLSDGRYAIVVENQPDQPLRPRVRVTHDEHGLQFTPPLDLDLSIERDVQMLGATGGLPSDN